MKNIILIISLLSFLCFNLYSQDESFYSNDEQETKPPEQEKFHAFFGAGIGVNNHCGLIGTLVEYSPAKKISFIGGFGFGGWGTKAGIGLRYYNRGFPRKLFYGLTLTTASGFQNYEVELETTTEPSEKVVLNLNRANNLALSLGYQWMLFRNGRLNFEVGYSIPLQDEAYEVVTPGVELSETSKTVMNLMTPGGIVIGLGFTIGF